MWVPWEGGHKGRPYRGTCRFKVDTLLAYVGLFAVIWLRFGLLTDLVSRIVYLLALSYPLTDNPYDWYAGTTLFVLLAVSGLAVYGFLVSTAPARAGSC